MSSQARAGILEHNQPESDAMPLRVMLVCTGVGTLNRGIESFARECFDGLREIPGLDITLLKGQGPEASGEQRLWNLPRTGLAARMLGAALRRNPYTAEQLSSLLPLIREIRRRKPGVIFSSEANLLYQLHRWRELTGVSYRLLFSNGAPGRAPFDRTDYVHQVNPVNYREALDAGEPPVHQIMVPYGINVSEAPEPLSADQIGRLRERLGLPIDRPVVLTVGHIGNSHKRMDYLIDEVAALPESRPFLAMIGAMDESTPPYLQRARERLGADGFLARSVPYREVAGYYRAADLFALASLREGFGRVYLEALMYGLPVIANDHPVMQYVIGSDGYLADLSHSGAMARAILQEVGKVQTHRMRHARWERVRRLFDWRALAPQYLEMFQHVASGPVRPRVRRKR